MKNYDHSSPLARALEVIGEKWSLLIVWRLCNEGPARFTDLMDYLNGITPKWLTLRLRDLESAGIVRRDSEKGRREVWYNLTDRGRELEGAMVALVSWGVRNALRFPYPSELRLAPYTLYDVIAHFNYRKRLLARPATWVIHFHGLGKRGIRFDGERWALFPADAAADLTVYCEPEDWGWMITTRDIEERARRVERMRFEGPAEQQTEFKWAFRTGQRAPAD